MTYMPNLKIAARTGSPQAPRIPTPDPGVDLNLVLHQMAESLGMAVDAKDTCTFAHSEEVAVLSQFLAVRLGYSPQEAEIVHIAAHLHDIGKIGVPDVILLKPGRLDPDELAMIRRHPEIGAGIVRPVKAFAEPGGVADMILYHHERYDGQGYPHCLHSREIPIGARIIAVADSLSAMLQPRPYKDPKPFTESVREIRTLAGICYDPDVVAALWTSRDQVRSLLAGSRATLSFHQPVRFQAAARALFPDRKTGQTRPGHVDQNVTKPDPQP